MNALALHHHSAGTPDEEPSSPADHSSTMTPLNRDPRGSPGSPGSQRRSFTDPGSRLRLDSESEMDVRTDSDPEVRGQGYTQKSRPPSDDDPRSRLGSDSGQGSRLSADTDCAEVEAWLDDHPDFTKDFFMR